MNKFYMNGKLIHKASDHNTKRCEVEKWVFLPHLELSRNVQSENTQNLG